jgi:transposase
MQVKKQEVPQNIVNDVKKMYAEGLQVKDIMQKSGLSMSVMYRIIGNDRRKVRTSRMCARGDAEASLKQIHNTLTKSRQALTDLKSLKVGQQVRLTYKVKNVGKKTDDYSSLEPDFMAPDMGIVKQICVKGVCVQGTDKRRMVYVSVADMVQKKVLVEVVH